MSVKQRNYNVKDVDMLITASTIIESAIKNKAFLITKRTTWADPFFANLKTRIDNAVQNFLGVDSAKNLRQATAVVIGLQKNAITDLAEFKIQIVEDFKNDKPRRDEILNQLGFTSYHKQAQKGDQEGLINLLFQYKTNMVAALKTEITAKGTAATLIDRIITYANTLKNADVTQETFKGTRKELTEASLKEFNEIYEAVISICKISTKFFKDKPALKDQFSFNKVAKVLNKTNAQINTPTPPPTA